MGNIKSVAIKQTREHQKVGMNNLQCAAPPAEENGHSSVQLIQAPDKYKSSSEHESSASRTVQDNILYGLQTAGLPTPNWLRM